jgi:hypothetical protein
MQNVAGNAGNGEKTLAKNKRQSILKSGTKNALAYDAAGLTLAYDVYEAGTDDDLATRGLGAGLVPAAELGERQRNPPPLGSVSRVSPVFLPLRPSSVTRPSLTPSIQKAAVTPLQLHNSTK